MRRNENLHNFLRNFGITDEEYSNIRNNVVESNYKNLKILGSIGALFLLFLVFLSVFFYEDGSWIAYLISFVFCAASCILNEFFTKKNNKFLKYFVYMVVFAFVGNGMMMGLYFEKDAPAVSFICYLIIMPTVFTERPYRQVIFQGFFVIFYNVLAIFLKDPEYMKTDLVNVTLFGVISIIVNIFLGRMKILGFLNEYKVDQLAHIDALTKLKNRMSYEETLVKYPDMVKKSLSCIYTDINGLHEMNNEKGHDEGDRMIITIANILKEAIGKGNVYRTGGDEFVGFLLDADEKTLRRTAEEIDSKINEAGYSIAIGFVYQEKDEIDMHKLVMNAELLMYKNKGNYYSSIGSNPRITFFKEDSKS